MMDNLGMNGDGNHHRAATIAAAAHNNGLNGFQYDAAAKTLKNYATGLGMYWPGGFDSTTNAMFNAAYAASSAQALAAATGMSMGQTPTTPTGSMKGESPMDSVSMSQSAAAAAASQAATMVAASLVSSGGSLFPATSSLVTRSFAHSTTPTPKKKAQPVPTHMKDDNYWERRNRNNESARRSRENRRVKEEQIAMRVVYLEQENVQLKTECSMLRSEIEKLRMILCNTTQHRS